MNEQENARFDALMKLADFRRQYRESRRATEWRVTIATWALMIGIATTLKSYAIGYVVVTAFLVAGFHYFWVLDNFEKCESDAKKMWKHFDAARDLAKAEEPEPPKGPKSLFYHFPAFAAVFVTVSLGILAVAFTRIPSPADSQESAVTQIDKP